jgi:hypothetical protein
MMSSLRRTLLWIEFIVAGVFGALLIALLLRVLLSGHRDPHDGFNPLVGGLGLVVCAASFLLGAFALRTQTRLAWLAQAAPILTTSWALRDILAHPAQDSAPAGSVPRTLNETLVVGPPLIIGAPDGGCLQVRPIAGAIKAGIPARLSQARHAGPWCTGRFLAILRVSTCEDSDHVVIHIGGTDTSDRFEPPPSPWTA